MLKKLLVSGFIAVITFTTLTYVGAQTASPDILGAAGNNFRNARSMRVTGSVDTTFDTNSLSDNLIFRLFAPSDWIGRRMKGGLNFVGNVQNHDGNRISSWQLTPNFITPSTTVSVVTQGNTAYVSAGQIFGFLAENGVNMNTTTQANTTTTTTGNQGDWIAIDFPRFAGELGLNGSGVEQRWNVVMDAMNNPGRYFRVTRVADQNVNGVANYHFRLTATNELLDALYPQSAGTGGGFNRSGRGDLWIQRDTMRPTRVDFSTSLTETGRTRDIFSVNLNFDQYDQMDSIEAPSGNIRSIEEVLHHVFGRLRDAFTPTEVPPVVFPTTTGPTTTPGVTTTTTSTVDNTGGGGTTTTPTTTPPVTTTTPTTTTGTTTTGV